MRVLVAADQPDVLRLLDRKLSRAGYDTAAAAGLEDAQRRCAEHLPDALIIEGEAWRDSLTSAIRALPGGSRPVIIVLGPDGSAPAVAASLRAGADDHVRLPFSPAELLHRLTVALVRRGLHPATAG